MYTFNDAFKALNALEEDVFDVNAEDSEKLKQFLDGAEDIDYEIIVDPDAETEEEVQDSYEGDVILKCAICQQDIFKKPEEVIINDELGIANETEECPYCHSIEGFKVIGQVAPFVESDKETEEDTETIEVNDTEIDNKEDAEVKEDNTEDTTFDLDEALGIKKDLKESDKPAATSIEDAQKWVDYDMKKYGRISAKTNKLVKKAGFQIIKDDHGDYEVTAGQFEACKEDIKEDFEKVDIETDKEKMSMTAEENGKITVTTEPKENSEEMIAPLDLEVEDKFEVVDEPKEEDESTIDIDIDEFDEDTFDELGEKYLKRVYENVRSFKTTQGKIKGNSIKLEGVITFKSGKVGKTSFIFEGKSATKNKEVVFEGLNTNFARGKKAFILKGNIQDKKLVCESLTYNYTGKDAATNQSKRLYGRVKI